MTLLSNCFITISIPYHGPQEGGGGLPCHRKGGGFSGLNTKADTDGQPDLTIPYTNHGLQKNYFGMDAMKKLSS